MPHELPPRNEHPEISGETLPPLEFSGTYTLMVNGEMLKPEHGVELLRRVLTEGKEYILEAMERGRQEQQNRFPGYSDIEYPAIEVMKLSNKIKKVVTDEAYWRHHNPFMHTEDVREEFLPFWNVVLESGFTPDINDIVNINDPSHRARNIFLRARHPDAPPPYETY